MIRQNRSLATKWKLVLAIALTVGANSLAVHASNIPFDTTEMDTYMLMAENRILTSNGVLGSVSTPDANMAVTKQEADFTSLSNTTVVAETGIGLRVDGPNNVSLSGTTIKDSGATTIPVNYNYDHSALNSALDVAKIAIEGYAATQIWDMGVDFNVGAAGGTGNAMNKILVDTTLTVVGSGLHIIDLLLDGSSNELLINSDSTLTIDAPADATVIIRMPAADEAGSKVLQVTNGNLARSGGLQEGSVMFYSDDSTTSNTFNFNNVNVDCVAFWNIYDDSNDDAEKIRFNNVTGSTQLVANQIDLQNIVSLSRCSFGFSAIIPEPSTLSLLALGCIAAIGRRRR